MNEYIATGTIMKPLNMGVSENGEPFLHFLLKCPRSYSGKQRQDEEYDVFDCYIYNEFRMKWAKEYLAETQRVLIKGELRTGKNRRVLFVLIEHIEFAGSSRYKDALKNKKNTDNAPASASAPKDKSVKKENCINAGNDTELPF